MPSLQTNGSLILTQNQILPLIGSKFHTVESQFHCESPYCQVYSKWRKGLKDIYDNGNNAYWDIMSEQEEKWFCACSSGELRCTKSQIAMLDSVQRLGLETPLTLTVNCTLWSVLFWTWVFKILSHCTVTWLESVDILYFQILVYEVQISIYSISHSVCTNTIENIGHTE